MREKLAKRKATTIVVVMVAVLSALALMLLQESDATGVDPSRDRTNRSYDIELITPGSVEELEYIAGYDVLIGNITIEGCVIDSIRFLTGPSGPNEAEIVFAPSGEAGDQSAVAEGPQSLCLLAAQAPSQTLPSVDAPSSESRTLDGLDYTGLVVTGTWEKNEVGLSVWNKDVTRLYVLRNGMLVRLMSQTLPEDQLVAIGARAITSGGP